MEAPDYQVGAHFEDLDEGVLVAALKLTGYFFPFQFPWKWGVGFSDRKNEAHEHHIKYLRATGLLYQVAAHLEALFVGVPMAAPQNSSAFYISYPNLRIRTMCHMVLKDTAHCSFNQKSICANVSCTQGAPHSFRMCS